MNEVKQEIVDVQQAFGYSFDEAVMWIKAHIFEYDSIFTCDLNRYLSGDAVAKQYGVVYDTVFEDVPF